MSNPARFAVAAALGAGLLSSPAPAHANAVLGPATQSDPTTLDLQIAVAVTPFGTTRWTRVHAAGTTRVMWLVPVRPGAAVDWAPEAWLDALDDATAVRIAAPDGSPPCGMPIATERALTFGSLTPTKVPTEIALHATESAARAHVAAEGFAVSSAMATRIAQIYAGGSALVSITLATSTGDVTSPTLRVSDDGAAVLPLALTGSSASPARVTAWVVAAGSVTVGGMVDVDEATLSWGASQSSYVGDRSRLLYAGLGSRWLRESASRAPLFDGYAVPRASSVSAAADTYFRYAGGSSWATCAASTRSASTAVGLVGRACAPGATLSVPGGAGCAPTAGDVAPASVSCDGGAIDLALALSGTSPAATSVTRLAGIVRQGALGADLAMSPSQVTMSPVATAAFYEGCPVTAPTRPDGSSGGSSSGSSSGGIVQPPAPRSPADEEVWGGSSSGGDVVYVSSGCSGDTSTSSSSSSSSSSDDDDTYDDSSSSSSSCDGDTSSSSDGWDDGDSDSGCGGDSSTSSSSSSSSEGWDDSDGDSGSGCGGDSSDSGDSCGSDTSSSRAAPKAKRSSSKMSRYAMLFAFILLPLRRGARKLR